MVSHIHLSWANSTQIAKLLLKGLFLYLPPIKVHRIKLSVYCPTVMYSALEKVSQPSLEASTSARDLLYHALVNILTFDKINVRVVWVQISQCRWCKFGQKWSVEWSTDRYAPNMHYCAVSGNTNIG